jgi:hypothetical protein
VNPDALNAQSKRGWGTRFEPCEFLLDGVQCAIQRLRRRAFPTGAFCTEGDQGAPFLIVVQVRCLGVSWTGAFSTEQGAPFLIVVQVSCLGVLRIGAVCTEAGIVTHVKLSTVQPLLEGVLL